ncbi:hypothetical protein XENOCAPTIV_008537, partial [Xenoophorus captivus]
ASPYPLILSLENHCSVKQQTVMARHLKSILGDKLLFKPLTDLESASLPTPEDLKGKILVKGKKERMVEEYSSSSSDLDSSEEEGRSAGSTPQASAFSHPTTTLRKCGMLAVRLPLFMRQPNTSYNPENVGGGPGHRPVLLTIRVRWSIIIL